MGEVVVFVLDQSLGLPAEGVPVSLWYQDAAPHWRKVVSDVTDHTGSMDETMSANNGLAAGVYRLDYELGTYFSRLASPCFYPQISVHFNLAKGERLVLPLLITPFSYTTYRGN